MKAMAELSIPTELVRNMGPELLDYLFRSFRSVNLVDIVGDDSLFGVSDESIPEDTEHITLFLQMKEEPEASIEFVMQLPGLLLNKFRVYWAPIKMDEAAAAKWTLRRQSPL